MALVAGGDDGEVEDPDDDRPLWQKRLDADRSDKPSIGDGRN